MTNDSGQDGDFTIAWERLDGKAIVRLCGEFDLAGTTEFEHHVAQALVTNPPDVIFDLTGLAFIDSSGVAALFGAVGRASAKVRLDPESQPARTLRLMGMIQVLDVVDSQA